MGQQLSGDVVVVGGGTTGIVIAARLAEAGVDVVLLEEGPSDRDVAESSDLSGWKSLLGSSADYSFTVEEPHDRIAYSAGRLLGGSSAINNAWTFSTLDADLTRWSADGLSGWGPQDIARALQRAWAKVAPSPVSAPHPASEAFLAAAAAWGMPAVGLGGSRMTAGAGLVPLGAHGALRRTVAAPYLHDVGDVRCRPRTMTGVRAERILIDSRGRAIGVETTAGSVRSEQVVVAAGAVGSPWLLMRSGIGDGDELRNAGIRVTHHLPDVGRHLQDHPLTGVSWDASQTAGPPLTHSWETAAFLSRAVSDEELDLCLLFSTSREHFARPSRGDGYTIGAYLCRPRSRGRVLPTGPSSADRPRIQAPLLTDDGADAAALAKAIGIARELAAQDPLAVWLGIESEPGWDASPDALTAFLCSTTSTMYHLSGTCRMGSGPGRVVDERLGVDGVPGLRVADASILPLVTSTPPYMTCVMIGERCADFVLEERGVPHG